MQTLTIGRSTYKLSPSRNVGELQTKLSKFTGKTKRTAIAKDRRYYPSFYAGQSTSEYVNAFYDGNALGPLKMFGQLNTEPCTLYSGADLHETLTDENDCATECATIAQDPLPVDPAPIANVPAPIFQNRDRTPLQYLPIFVRLAVEWIDSNSEMRNTQALDDMIDAYAKTYGASCDDADRKSAHYLCARRFWDFLVIPADPAPADPAPAAATPAFSIIPADTLREMNQAHGIATEQIRAIKSYSLGHTGSHVADMLRAEAERYGRRSDEIEPSEAWARIYRQISDTLHAAAEFLLEPVAAPLPRVIYSEFIRSAGKREVPMMA